MAKRGRNKHESNHDVLEKMQCYACKELFQMPSEYDEHVMECFKKHGLNEISDQQFGNQVVKCCYL